MSCPGNNKIVGPSSKGKVSLSSREPSRRQNLSSSLANNCRHLGHCFISSTYFHCNLFLKRVKSFAVSSEIFMKFFLERAEISFNRWSICDAVSTCFERGRMLIPTASPMSDIVPALIGARYCLELIDGSRPSCSWLEYQRRRSPILRRASNWHS